MKLNSKKIFWVGFAFMIICLFWQIYDNIVAKMLINSFGLDQFWSGVVLAIDNVLALFMLPLFGALSDKTKTKYGKRTPYIFFGTLAAALLFIGVALFDNMQQKAVTDYGIPAVIEVVEEDDPNFGLFTYRGMLYGDTDAGTYGTKEAATTVRSAEVLQYTKQNVIYFILFMIVLLLVLIAMATYRTPAVSLMPDVTPKPLRSKANAIINLMGTAGGIIALAYPMLLAKFTNSYIVTFAVLALLMIIFLGIFMLKVKEPKLVQEMHEESRKYGIEEEVVVETEKQNGPDMSPEVRKSFYLIMASIIFWFMAYNAATSKFSVFAEDALDMGYNIPLLIAQGAAVISYIPIGIIASKYGRKKTIMAGIIILFSAFLLGSIVAFTKTKPLIYVTMGVAGIGWATINVNSYPMVVEMSKEGNIGKYTGYYYTASMFAQIITPMLSGAIMALVNTKISSGFGYRVLFPYCVLFCII
ncbi:MAG: MFS transporter, partial [Bacilli bacterium]|nr:MFS transporter [Bacilli bacterium]